MTISSTSWLEVVVGSEQVVAFAAARDERSVAGADEHTRTGHGFHPRERTSVIEMHLRREKHPDVPHLEPKGGNAGANCLRILGHACCGIRMCPADVVMGPRPVDRANVVNVVDDVDGLRASSPESAMATVWAPPGAVEDSSPTTREREGGSLCILEIVLSAGQVCDVPAM